MKMPRATRPILASTALARNPAQSTTEQTGQNQQNFHKRLPISRRIDDDILKSAIAGAGKTLAWPSSRYLRLRQLSRKAQSEVNIS